MDGRKSYMPQANSAVPSRRRNSRLYGVNLLDSSSTRQNKQTIVVEISIS